MAKRKTRKQKVISDHRRELSLNNKTVTHYTLPSKSIEEKPRIERQIKESTTANAYPYLKGDLRKTGILTLIIVALQLSLFYLLQNHIVSLPGLIY
jgi:hypothetical protein